MHTEQGKDVADRQATEDAIAAKEVAENHFVVLNEELWKVKISHEQALLAHNAEIINLRLQLVNAQKKVGDAEYERDEAKARLQ